MDEFTPLPGCDLLIIAGEASGDEHAARLVAGLHQRDPSLRIAALGGHQLMASGVHMLGDLAAHAAVGFWEVLKHIGAYIRFMDGTVRWVRENKPRAILFVDFVGFNLELAKRLYDNGLSHKAGGATRLYFYISPQIWIWKKKRRFVMERYLDSVGCIFPFEPPHYADTTLPARFVGHPFVQQGYTLPVTYDPDGPILLLPGSRQAIVKKHMGLMWDAFTQYQKTHPTSKAAAYYANEARRQQMLQIVGAGQLALYPAGAPVRASAVLCVAGTASFMCALAGVPGAVVYQTDPLTYYIGKKILPEPTLGMANIILKRHVMPEYLQHAATPLALATELERLHSPQAIATAQAAAQELHQVLSAPASMGTVEWVMEAMGK